MGGSRMGARHGASSSARRQHWGQEREEQQAGACSAEHGPGPARARSPWALLLIDKQT